MSRRLTAVAYVATTGSTATALASLAAWPFPPSVQGLVFVLVGLTTVSMAGALTPRSYCLFTRTPRKDGRP